MSKIRSICVYCGSRKGAGDEYARLAESVGASIAAAGLTLVYGGGQVGLMGIAARAALATGGKVIGVIPEHLDTIEIAQTGLSELHVVADMHTRKRMMFDRSDAFLVLPGGLGSLDEFIEVTTWAQLDLHDRPILLLNHRGYWNPLLDLLRRVVQQGVELRPVHGGAGSGQRLPPSRTDRQASPRGASGSALVTRQASC